MNRKRALSLFLALLLTTCLLTGCGAGTTVEEAAAPEQASANIFAMDTYMSITCYGARCEEALAAAEAEIVRLDALLSVGSEESEISRINTSGSGLLSSDTAAMVETALSVWQDTDGAFDITIYPLMELWGFTTKDFQVPASDELQALLALCGSEKLTYEDGTLTLAEGQGIDLGGIAKGYTSGRLMEIFAEYELDSALVSLGGNVHCYGSKPDGSLWRCGIQDPLNPEDKSSYIGIVSISGKAVITSGAYERYFTDEATGQTYHHILDPETGYPADSGLISVSVVSDDGTLADALSTACYVMGLDRSLEYWKSRSTDFDLILMTDDGSLYITGGLKDCFTSSLDFTVIGTD